MKTATDFLLWGMVIHFFCDFALQNNWQANNKHNLRHPAAWVHSGIHLFFLCFLFPPVIAVGIATAHLLIDTRVPLKQWRIVFRQLQDESHPIFPAYAMWQDQSAHIVVLAIAALIAVR